MKFNPLELDEIKQNYIDCPLVEGEATFTVFGCTEGKSKANDNQQLKLHLLLKQDNGQSGFIYDYLVGVDNAVWKISLFCKACGQEGKYKEGQLTPEQIKGWSGKCMLKMEKNEEYGDKLKIAGYVAEEEQAPEVDLGDELPF